MSVTASIDDKPTVSAAKEILFVLPEQPEHDGMEVHMEELPDLLKQTRSLFLDEPLIHQQDWKAACMRLLCMAVISTFRVLLCLLVHPETVLSQLFLSQEAVDRLLDLVTILQRHNPFKCSRASTANPKSNVYPHDQYPHDEIPQTGFRSRYKSNVIEVEGNPQFWGSQDYTLPHHTPMATAVEASSPDLDRRPTARGNFAQKRNSKGRFSNNYTDPVRRTIGSRKKREEKEQVSPTGKIELDNTDLKKSTANRRSTRSSTRHGK